MTRYTSCEWCDEPVNPSWALRIADTSPRNATGPLYFCCEDHRQQYRHHYPDVL